MRFLLDLKLKSLRSGNPKKSRKSGFLITKAVITLGFFNSFGLMHRTKKGWQALSVFMSRSSDCRNCVPRVGVRLRVSVPIENSSLKRPLRYLNLDLWMTWTRSALNVSRFFSKKPV